MRLYLHEFSDASNRLFVAMLSLIRETVFGRIVRIATRKGVFRFDEEVDPAGCVAFLTNAGRQGEVPNGQVSHKNGEFEEGDLEKNGSDAIDSNGTADGDTGKTVIVDWYGPHDQGIWRMFFDLSL